MKDWAGTGEAFAASYAQLCLGTAEALIVGLGPPRGRSVLDVGAGTGALAARLAQAGWDATGCEPEPSMRDVAQRDHPRIPMRDGALPDLRLGDAAFDAVTANFVLNHVQDPRASASEMARVSADVLAATIWSRSPSWFWLEVCESADITPAAGERLPAEKDFERTADGFAGMLSDAGWRDVKLDERAWTWYAEPAVLWASAEGGVASAGAFYAALAPDDRARFRGGFDAVCERRVVRGAIPLEHVAVMAVGRARD
ncbi:class I SAM-dependent methyltransferase [Microbacterium sp. NPDC056234]|uniref:class I SAM-dependent methyltransferase n=1 Tax=Microbacterium sp. NPDC056234 TaxID=3345757 RepID=UPI0035D9B398